MKRKRKFVVLGLGVLTMAVPFACHAEEDDDSYKLAPIEVIGTLSDEGRLDNDVNSGPLKSTTLLDTPYQITTISSELIEDQFMVGFEDTVKYLPSSQIEYRGGAEMGRPQTRGFEGSVVDNTFWDGFHVISTTAIPMSLFDELQVTNGLAGSLYGSGNPSGIFNLTRKRPGDTFESAATLLYTGDENFGIQGEVSGRKGIVGLRANVLYDDGEGYVSNSNRRRELEDIALDLHLTDDLVIENNYSHYVYDKTGYAGSFKMPVLSGGVAAYTLPDAVSSDTEGLGQAYSGVSLETTTASSKIKYKITDNWNFEGGYLFQRADRGSYAVSNTFTSDAGDYSSSQALGKAPGQFEIGSWMAQVQTEAELLGMKHDLAVAENGYRWDMNTSSIRSSSVILGSSNIYNPAVFASPGGFSKARDLYTARRYNVNSLALVDSITIAPQWKTILSVSENWLKQDAYSSSGAVTQSYDETDESYAASVVYKPMEQLSLYTTYADSVQAGSQGENSDGTMVVLAPVRSKQYEVGAKTSWETIDLSAALFQIERPLAFTGDDGVFCYQGQQVNRGLEVMTTWRALRDLKFFGGFTLLDPKLTDTKLAATDDQQVIGVPKFQANLLMQYTVPALTDLSFDANLHYTGKRPIDQANTEWVDDYFTFDLGVRYVTHCLFGKMTIFRVSVDNVFDEEYWAGVFASGTDGDGSAGSTSLFLGEPRTISASIQVRF